MSKQRRARRNSPYADQRTLEAAWLVFRQRDISPTASDVQLGEMRKAFMAGAATMVRQAREAIERDAAAVNDEGTAKLDHLMEILEHHADELIQYVRRYNAGLDMKAALKVVSNDDNIPDVLKPR